MIAPEGKMPLHPSLAEFGSSRYIYKPGFFHTHGHTAMLSVFRNMLLVHTSVAKSDAGSVKSFQSAATVHKPTGGLDGIDEGNEEENGSHSGDSDLSLDPDFIFYDNDSEEGDAEYNGDSEGAMNSLSPAYQKEKQFSSYVRSFIPARYGGELESTIVHINLPESSETIQESSETIEDVSAEDANSLQHFYKVLPGWNIISVDVLFLLASWPNIASLTDEKIFWLTNQMDFVPRMRKESLRNIYMEHKKLSRTYNECQTYFEKSCILKAGLTALCSCLTLCPKEEGSQQDLPNFFRPRSFDKWSKELYNLKISRFKIKGAVKMSLSSFQSKLLEGILSHVDGHMSEMQLLALHRAWIFEDAIMKKKIGIGDTALEHMHVEAQKLDKAYACMVHGSCMKVPLVPDIWCPHEGIESVIPIGRETDSFFKASFFYVFLMFFFEAGW
jgi:hypothetical protein